MSSEKERKFLRLFKFSFDLSQRVARLYTEFNILKSDSLSDFISKHKHVIYHLWSNKVRCCDCNNYPGFTLPPNQVLNKESQFDKLCNITKKHNHSHFVKNGTKVQQHCLCAIEVIPACTLEELDVTIIHTLLRNCALLPSDDEKWLNEITVVRNKVSHANSTSSYDDMELGDLWRRLETAVQGLAGKIQFKTVAIGISNEIKLLKNANLTEEDVIEIIECVNENKNLVESLKDCFEENIRLVVARQDMLSTEVKQQLNMIVEFLKKETKELKVGIDHLTFDIQYIRDRKTDKEAYVYKADVKRDAHSTSDEPSVSNLEEDSQADVEDDQSICEVRWHLSTPDDWNVQKIKEILQNVMSMSSSLGSFRIRFVYDGSLVIQTTTSRETVEDKEKLEVSIEVFLKELVKICSIETDKKQTVKVEIALSSGDGVFDSSMKDLTSSSVICPHCEKLINCDPCHKKSQLIKDFAMSFASTDTKKADVKETTETFSQKTDEKLDGKRTIDDHAIGMKHKTNPTGQSTAQAVIEKRKHSMTEEENHLHLVFLLTNMARRAVKWRFDQSFPLELLASHLRWNYSLIKSWRQKNILTDQQLKCLYPNYSSAGRILDFLRFTPEGIVVNSNSNTYDLQLMITFLKHQKDLSFGKVDPYLSKFHNLDSTLSQLEDYRNVLINSDPKEIDDAKYNEILVSLTYVTSKFWRSQLEEEYDHYRVRILNT